MAAKEALQASLGQNLTLEKKRSWYSNARDFVHRSATQAKDYVDGLRGESSKTKQLRCPCILLEVLQN